MRTTVITHEADAARYVECGWTIKSFRDVELKGINKTFVECTLVWENGGEPIDPIGEYTPMETKPSQERK